MSTSRAWIVGFVAVLVLSPGCDDGKAKVKEVAKKVDKAIDDFDLEDAKQKLIAAKDALGRGIDAVAECSWAASVGADVVKDPVVELRRLCSFDAPLGRATRAVEKAEKARAEQPDAPSLTECASDAYAKAARELDDKFGSEPRWTAVKTRWKNVCPGG